MFNDSDVGLRSAASTYIYRFTLNSFKTFLRSNYGTLYNCKERIAEDSKFDNYCSSLANFNLEVNMSLFNFCLKGFMKYDTCTLNFIIHA